MATHTLSPSFFIERIMLVLARPRECWNTVAPERIEPMRLYVALSLPLAALAAVSHRLSVASMQGAGARSAISEHALSLASEILMLSAIPLLAAWLVVRLCSFFASHAEFGQAFSLVAHAIIPWSLMQAIPGSSGIEPLYLVAGASYTLFILYCGLGMMLHVPPAQRTPLFVTLFVILFLFGAVMASLAAVVTSMMSTAPSAGGLLGR